MKKILLSAVMTLFVVGCTNNPNVRNDEEIINKDDYRTARMGKILGEDALLFNGDEFKDHNTAGSSGIGVNTYLWRASLETISFMAIKSVDPFGGVIISEWYTDPSAPKERVKVVVLIQDKRLRADALKVNMTRQTQDIKGQWVNTTVKNQTERDLEDTILKKARQLKIAEGK